MTLIDVSHRLRARDYAIASLLDEHTTLTTDQLTAVLFSSVITCRHRLTTLRSFGFVERFIRRDVAGTPNIVCWVPGPLSARLTALATGQSPPTARALRERQDRVYANPALDHLLGTNEFFTRLLAHARLHQRTGLRRWWSERSAAAAFGQRIHPDGHGVWAEHDRETGFFLELDRGTEPLARLADKLSSYRRLVAEGGPPYAVLFALPNRTREQNLHRRLADRPESGLIVASTSPESGDDPAGPVWRLVGNGRHRLALADLPGGHGQPGPLNPGPPEPAEHPLRHLR
ncbi:replication-relaxation family protein [Actinoplanes sp. NPDC051343]|uniref:replication-relaxation family protein n=1 Tax=Actinoplanes sp. NPDC051343 TaxID=3363906 RepID=UPI00379DDCF6